MPVSSFIEVTLVKLLNEPGANSPSALILSAMVSTDAPAPDTVPRKEYAGAETFYQ